MARGQDGGRYLQERVFKARMSKRLPMHRYHAEKMTKRHGGP